MSTKEICKLYGEVQKGIEIKIIKKMRYIQFFRSGLVNSKSCSAKTLYFSYLQYFLLYNLIHLETTCPCYTPSLRPIFLEATTVALAVFFNKTKIELEILEEN